MSDIEHQLHRVPEIVTKGLQEQELLEAELFSLDAQVRNFGRLRDRFAATGGDASAFYRDLQARRDKIIAALTQFPSRFVPPNIGTPPLSLGRIKEPLLSLPLAPATFIPPLGIFGFGTSGYVQMAPATSGVDVVATGTYPTSGDFTQINTGYPGQVYFGGVLTVGPDELPVGQSWDPTINYFWVRNWKYLIAFPPPSVLSRFTYSFNVDALVSIFFDGLDATAMVFVSVGETANLMTGNDVVVDIPAGWPLMADLTQPTAFYNGRYGDIEGSQVTVQRSFMVQGGHFPGVAVVVGIIGGLAMGTRAVAFAVDQYSVIAIYTGDNPGRVAYHYEPEPVFEP